MPRSRPTSSLALAGALAGALVLAVGQPATPVAAQEPAGRETVVGELVRAWAEPRSPEEATGVHEAPLTWVEPARGDVVRLTGDRAEELPVGATVEVQVGEEVVDAAAAEGGLEPAREVVAAEVVAPAEEGPVGPASAAHTNEVTVAMVAPIELVPPAPGLRSTDADTAAEVAAVVAGPVADFWQAQTYGAVTIGVAPTDADNEWYQSNIQCSNYAALWSETANRVGFTPGPGKHLMLYLPEAPATMTGCEYGVGTIGASLSHGGLSYVRDDVPSVMAHELGHNFGLGHSSLMQCDYGIEGPAPCGWSPYGDLYDVMGASWDAMGSLSALHGRLLGVLPDEQVHQVGVTDPTADYALSPLSSRTGRVGLRLAWGDLVYWLEYRTASGQDAWLGTLDPGDVANPRLQTGVLLRVEDAADGDTSLLLDGTPPSQAFFGEDLQTVLPAGQSFWLAQGAFHVTVRSTTASQAVVRVSTRTGAPVPRDLDRNLRGDLLTVAPDGTLWNHRASATGGIAGRVAVGRGWGGRDALTMTGDWNGDGVHDLLSRDYRTGNLLLNPGNGRGGLGAARVVGRGWLAMNAVFSPGDWSGDGVPDVLARRRSDGGLFLYAGTGSGGVRAGVRIGNGWNGMTALAATGDFDSNGTVDFVARRNDGVLLLYPGDGRGSFGGSPRMIGRGWQGFSAIVGPGDWNGDGAADLLARRTDGTLRLYPGNGSGSFGVSTRIGTGWNGMRFAA